MLPLFQDTPYIEVHAGDCFGVIDIIGSCQQKTDKLIDVGEEFELWFKMKHRLFRQFSVRAVESCELQCFDLTSVYDMSQQYYEEYKLLFDNKTDLLRRATILKLKAIKMCQEQKAKRRIELDQLSSDSDEVSIGLGKSDDEDSDDLEKEEKNKEDKLAKSKKNLRKTIKTKPYDIPIMNLSVIEETTIVLDSQHDHNSDCISYMDCQSHDHSPVDGDESPVKSGNAVDLGGSFEDHARQYQSPEPR